MRTFARHYSMQYFNGSFEAGDREGLILGLRLRSHSGWG